MEISCMYLQQFSIQYYSFQLLNLLAHPIRTLISSPLDGSSLVIRCPDISQITIRSGIYPTFHHFTYFIAYFQRSNIFASSLLLSFSIAGEPFSLTLPFDSVVIISGNINWQSIVMSALGKIDTIEAGMVIENSCTVKDGFGNLIAPIHLFTGLQVESRVDVN